MPPFPNPLLTAVQVFPPSVLLNTPVLLPPNPDGLLERYMIEGFAGFIANEVTLGVTNPFMLGAQFRPTSVLLKTAERVPANNIDGVSGFTAMAVTISLFRP